MSVLTITALVVSKAEHNAYLKVVLQENAASLSKTMALQLLAAMQHSPDDKALYSEIMQPVREHPYVVSAVLYDVNYDVISQITQRANATELNPKIPTSPKGVPFGIAFNDDFIVVHHLIGSDLYPYGHIIISIDPTLYASASASLTSMSMIPVLMGIWLLCVCMCTYLLYHLIAPVTSLKKFTQDVFESKDYSLRSVYSSDNEIGRLSHNINSLLDTIEVELLINFEQKQTLVDQQETMSRLANIDSLTGLPNRQFVLDSLRLELARAKRSNEDLMLLFFDLDGFKGINDSLGHETGDLVLIEVAERVQKLLRDDDLFARLGGDEFLVLPDREVSASAAESLATRMIGAFDEPFELKGLSLTVGLSVGIATASDANYDLSELMSNADLAMYRSKARGRGSFTLFTPDMVETHKRKLLLANDIDRGISNDEFVLYYQVKVNNKGQVIGVEALVRWRHPEFGLVMPCEFIPIAEQGGKISAISHWVIRRVCLDMSKIKSWAPPSFRVSINLSGHDLRNAQLFDQIYNTFTLFEINPENIEFEVTESAYLENFALSNKLFRRMGNMGCAIALDDFGTGYSSLSYLTQINIDTLKIDRQFVTEIQSSERSRLVTGAIIDLAKRLSLSVCAEGIENHEQWDYLIQHGCDSVQGFMFSEPLPLEDLIVSPLNYSRRRQVQ